jgi:hypothetical protein
LASAEPSVQFIPQVVFGLRFHDHSRHKQEVKEIYAKRKETIERVFADANGMCWTTLRGLKKLSMQAMLTFAALNLKENGQLDMEKSSNGLRV